VRIVVNRAARAEVTPADVERVFGRPALAVLPVDRRVRGVQDRGAMLPRRGRIGRELDRLARVLLEGAS
jgi:Flp pilus assembly CpaE family ATPase